MFDHKDDSGQVMLTNAILFAIIIIMITLMLNNIIYATNVAYVGFMDGTKYEDLSIRQMTTKEAAGAFHDYLPSSTDPLDENNVNTRSRYISDYVTAVNNLTNSKGKYVEILNRYYAPPNPPSYLGLKVTQTHWDLVITNKDSKVTYTISTGSTDPSAPRPSTTLQLPTASFSDDTYRVNEGGTCTVTVTLNHPYTDPIIIYYSTATINATSANYNDVSSSVTIPASELEGDISLPTKPDGLVAGTKAFTVNIVSTNPATGSTDSAIIFIEDTNTVTPPPPPSQSKDMHVDCTAVRENGGSKKDVTITTVVKNTGLTTLTNVNLTLVTPTGKPFVPPGVSPTWRPTDLAPGETWTITWIIQTQNQNDRINVWVKAAATELPMGITSDIQMNI